MGVEESSIFKRLCSRRRINVGCLGTRILRLPLPWPGTRTQIGLAENGQKGKVRQKIKWHEPDLSSDAAANGSKSHPRSEKKRIPHNSGRGRTHVKCTHLFQEGLYLNVNDPPPANMQPHRTVTASRR